MKSSKIAGAEISASSTTKTRGATVTTLTAKVQSKSKSTSTRTTSKARDVSEAKMVTFVVSNTLGGWADEDQDQGCGGGISGDGNNSGVPLADSTSTNTTAASPRLCSQCGRPAPCNHHVPHDTPEGGVGSRSSAAASTSTTSNVENAAQAHSSSHQAVRPRRLSKLKHRASTSSKQPDKKQNLKQQQILDVQLALLENASESSLNPHQQHQHRRSRSSASATGDISSTSATVSVSNPVAVSVADMEPPVLSFYGTEPVPLPTRFAHIKRNLADGHEEALSASWARLLAALQEEAAHIEAAGSHLTPGIDFHDIDDSARATAFARDLKRFGVGVVRGVVPRADAQRVVADTARYLEAQKDYKPPPPQDPTCFDFFWTPAQVRVRAHPNVLRAQRFMMGLWDGDADDRMATRFPIVYADRIRIHGASVGGVGEKSEEDDDESGMLPSVEGKGQGNGTGSSTAANGPSTSTTEAQKAAVELLGDFASSMVIAQVDNGSLERWEPDGYGRGGTYDAVFRGEWESYDPWDPTPRVGATPDLYNGFGACSIFRMFQGVLALSTIDAGMIRLLPSPKLATAYFLLRPFFSPRTKPPPSVAEQRRLRTGPEWDAFLDPANWVLDREQSTIIHGAVPGHAQRLTELWHPHLHLRRTLVTIPTLHPGDYILWHPDLAYHITSNGNAMASRAATPPPPSLSTTNQASGSGSGSRPTNAVSILVYVPAAPLTPNNALYLARQRKTFQRGHPGPDFDATGSGLGSEASHVWRPGEADIAETGGDAGLQAMGLAPFDVPGSSSSGASTGGGGAMQVDKAAADTDVVMVDREDGGVVVGGGDAGSSGPISHAEAEVARLSNIILFPDRYDFYMAAKRNGAATPRIKASGDA